MIPIASSGALGATPPSSFAFSSIPQNFTHLQLRVFAKFTGTLGLGVLAGYFNADTTTSNYTNHRLWGDGSSAFSFTNAGNLIYGGYVPDSTVANQYSCLIIDILDYANTNKNKTFRSIGGYDANGSGYVGLYSGSWMSTAAITSLTITSTNSMTAATRFDLYGITNSPATGA